MRRLRYLSIKSGDVYVTVGDMFKKDYLLTKTLEKVGAEDMQGLLELLDEDIDRLNQVGDIVEEVVNFVFRGRYKKDTQFYGLYLIGISSIAHELSIRDELGVPRVTFVVGLTYSHDYRDAFPRPVFYYKSKISLRLDYFESSKLLVELSDKVVDELAEIFENPDIKWGIMTSEGAVIYSREETI